MSLSSRSPKFAKNILNNIEQKTKKPTFYFFSERSEIYFILSNFVEEALKLGEQISFDLHVSGNFSFLNCSFHFICYLTDLSLGIKMFISICNSDIYGASVESLTFGFGENRRNDRSCLMLGF